MERGGAGGALGRRLTLLALEAAAAAALALLRLASVRGRGSGPGGLPTLLRRLLAGSLHHALLLGRLLLGGMSGLLLRTLRSRQLALQGLALDGRLAFDGPPRRRLALHRLPAVARLRRQQALRYRL